MTVGKFSKDFSTGAIYKINYCKYCDKVYIRQISRFRTREHKKAVDRSSLSTQNCIKSIMILTLTTSRSLTAVPNGQKYFLNHATQFANRMPLINTFTFLTFTRPLTIPSDVSEALFKHSFAYVSYFKLKKVIVF